MEFVQELFLAMATAAVPVIATFVCRWLITLSETNKVRVKNAKAQATIDQITDIIIAAVETTANTYVKQLKAENIFDVEAQKKAFDITFETVKKQVTAESEKILAELYGDVEIYLTNKIEQFVEELKNKK